MIQTGLIWILPSTHKKMRHFNDQHFANHCLQNFRIWRVNQNQCLQPSQDIGPRNLYEKIAWAECLDKTLLIKVELMRVVMHIRT